MERHISFIFAFILSKHALQATEKRTGTSQCVFALFIDSSGKKAPQYPKITDIAFLLHCWKTVFFFFFKAEICTEKRLKGSQGLNATQCPCGQKGKKMMHKQTDEPAETQSQSSLGCHLSLPDRPAKSHSAG